MPIPSWQTLRSRAAQIGSRLVPALTDPRTATAERQRQIVLSLLYQQHPEQLDLADVEFSTFSQNGEDGILLYLFAMIGTTNRTVVELCAGDGIECNAANLVVHHGWHGLLVDGDPNLVARGQRFYATARGPWQSRREGPVVVQHWITRENVNALVERHGFSGEPDLLSLDLDGVDYWIWEALTVRPRAVVLEYNNRWSAEQSVTVPYADTFAANPDPSSAGYFGASLAAFVKLGCRKGYRLVGANRPNTNAFFLRNDVAADAFPTVTAASCLGSDYAQSQHRTKYPLIQHLPVVAV